MKSEVPTKREIEVLGLIANEMTTKEIARQLFISYQTVLTHRKNLLWFYSPGNRENIS